MTIFFCGTLSHRKLSAISNKEMDTHNQLVQIYRKTLSTRLDFNLIASWSMEEYPVDSDGYGIVLAKTGFEHWPVGRI